MTGYWIDDGTKITCSVCGVDSRDFYPVCPHCRTTMDPKDKLVVMEIMGENDDDER